MKTNKHFLLYANCMPVKGAVRSTICDLQKGSYIFISNTQLKWIKYLESHDLNKLIEREKETSLDQISKFLDHLVKHDLGFFFSNPINFPKMNTAFETPYKIQDSIIELSKITIDNIDIIIKSLIKMRCQTIELRCYKEFSLKTITYIVKLIQSTSIRNVEIYMKDSPPLNEEEYLNLLESYPVIGLLIVHSSHSRKKSKENRLFFTNQPISGANCCGKISKDFLTINLPFYLESIKYNNCLNKKISITESGTIKNCPSQIKGYGNITNSNLDKAIKSPGFKELWNINKDSISVCKDCEFRYICSDCRAYVKNKYDKPVNCKYDPYTMTYSD